MRICLCKKRILKIQDFLARQAGILGGMTVKIKTSIILILTLLLGLTGCGKDILSEYDIDGLSYIAYQDIDTVCETESLTLAGQEFLESQADHILLSYAMDSAIELTDILGEYDHLVVANPAWIERFGNASKLKAVDFDDVAEEMQVFLQDQIAILTVDGSVLPNGTALYRYEGDELLVFPTNVTLGVADPIEAKNHLIILVDNPTETFKASAFLLPLTSSGNILFDNGDELQEAFNKNALKDYGAIETMKK